MRIGYGVLTLQNVAPLLRGNEVSLVNEVAGEEDEACEYGHGQHDESCPKGVAPFSRRLPIDWVLPGKLLNRQSVHLPPPMLVTLPTIVAYYTGACRKDNKGKVPMALLEGVDFEGQLSVSLRMLLGGFCLLLRLSPDLSHSFC
jgi:hypothetical protein